MILPRAYRQALANRRFRLVAIGFGLSSLGDGMSALGVAWLAIEISTSANRGLVVGAAVAAYTLPGAAGIFLGRLLEGFDSGRLLLLNCGLRAVGLGTIAVLSHLGRLDVLSYVVLLAGSALLSSWGTAARYALVAETLPESARLGGNSLLGTLLNAGFIAGPAAAGFITAATGAAAVLGLDAVSWLVYAAFVILAGTPHESATPLTVSGQDAQSGLRMIRGDRALLALLMLTLAFYFFYGPVEVALPIFVKQDLHQSAAVLGAYWTGFGIGAVAGGVAFGFIRSAPLFTIALAVIVGWGAGLAVIPFVDAPLGIAAFTLAGLIWSPYPTLMTTFLQRQASGRALTTLSAAWTSATTLATPLGTAIGGPLVAATGAGTALLVSAVATLAIVPVAVMTKAVRNEEANARRQS
ncbi:MAG TPA: MFS transporter [Candidatus Dormibacteraeota bacterium]|nr:MFS transporter [Candidatus Dormibacteraeota bacterium]